MQPPLKNRVSLGLDPAYRTGCKIAVIDQFGKDTMLIPIDEKHFTSTLPVELSPPFFAWVAAFGRGAKILSPQLAIDEMRKFIERVSDMYKDEG